MDRSPSEGTPEVHELMHRLETEIRSRWGPVMDTFPPARYIQLLDAGPDCSKYNRIPEDLAAGCRGVQHAHGMEALETLHKLVLACLVSQFALRTRGRAFPPGVVSLYRREQDRLLREMSSNPPGFYSLANDLFLKDLGLARTLLIPAGVEFVQLARGVPRSVLWKAGIRQFVSCLFMFFGRLRGFGPVFEIHMDPRRRGELSPDARAFSYRIVADLLAIHKDVKGLLGGSWFYDPALETITPRLCYLRLVPVQNGALVAYWQDEDGDSGALRYSHSRQRLFAQGLYRPKTYLLIWPRADLMHWAATGRRAEHQESPAPR